MRLHRVETTAVLDTGSDSKSCPENSIKLVYGFGSLFQKPHKIWLSPFFTPSAATHKRRLNVLIHLGLHIGNNKF